MQFGGEVPICSTTEDSAFLRCEAVLLDI